MRKNFLLGFLAAGLLALSLPAQAQLQTVQPNRRPTYSATIAALAPAASATDVFTITGSATKTIWVYEVGCSGISTAAARANVALVKRSTANSAGTSTAPTVVPHDSANSAGTATILAYTANPTTGTLVGIVRDARLATAEAATNATAPSTVVFRFGDDFSQPLVLRGITQVLAVNGNGASFAAGTSLSCWVSWSEG